MLFLNSLRTHAIFFVVPLLYLLTNMFLFRDVETYRVAGLSAIVIGMVSLTIPAGLAAVFLFRLVQYPTVLKPESPTRQMLSDVASLFRTPSIYVMGAAHVVGHGGIQQKHV